ncbi:MAG: tRNA 2-thiouridine(34) synthase MnmA [Clostridiales bacterium]|nr:tRNA 2-thiouridine(34) synthase MnmA [Bacillota bacterium]NLL54293.1 tRNA 2-thiouridine(34) synthase MnmA [Clostridiales bacterium]
MRVVVGLSGGVDSSVAALLLKEQGHEVIGVFMNNWEEADESGACSAERDWQDAGRVAEDIGIPYYGVNFAQAYRERVFAHFLEEYRRGRTPNPDVLCNREIKFGELLTYALGLGADKLATGHFAGVEERGRTHHLVCARDGGKDQTYFLYMLDQGQLGRAMFPLRDIPKKEVRRIAEQKGLPVFDKKDSTGVCFIGERNFKPFLMQYLPARPGDMVTPEGEVVGRHDGLMYYTLGQRRGLGIGGGGNGGRWFVLEKDLENNRLVVVQDESHPGLFRREARCLDASWTLGRSPAEAGETFACRVRLRHRQPLQEARLTVEGKGCFALEFAEEQRAVTPGQSAVIYNEGECLGGGVIQ